VKADRKNNFVAPPVRALSLFSDQTMFMPLFVVAPCFFLLDHFFGVLLPHPNFFIFLFEKF